MIPKAVSKLDVTHAHYGTPCSKTECDPRNTRINQSRDQIIKEANCLRDLNAELVKALREILPLVKCDQPNPDLARAWRLLYQAEDSLSPDKKDSNV